MLVAQVRTSIGVIVLGLLPIYLHTEGVGWPKLNLDFCSAATATLCYFVSKMLFCTLYVRVACLEF